MRIRPGVFAESSWLLTLQPGLRQVQASVGHYDPVAETDRGSIRKWEMEQGDHAPARQRRLLGAEEVFDGLRFASDWRQSQLIVYSFQRNPRIGRCKRNPQQAKVGGVRIQLHPEPGILRIQRDAFGQQSRHWIILVIAHRQSWDPGNLISQLAGSSEVRFAGEYKCVTAHPGGK